MGLKDITNAFKIAATVLKEELKLSSVGKMTDEQFKAFADYNNFSTYSILRSTGVQFQTDAYNLCPQLQAAVNKKAQALTRGKLIPVDNNDLQIKSKAFDDAMKVIRKPNAYQTRSQFLMMADTFRNVYGSVFIYKVKPFGGDKITGLIILPNPCVTVTLNKPSNILSNQAKLVRSYMISIYGMTFSLYGDDTDLIYEVQDSTVNLTIGKEFEAKSRVDALRKNIENIIGSVESRNHLIVKRGADVIISPESGQDGAGVYNEIDDNEKKRIQEDYRKYGLLSKQWHTLISKYPIRATKIGMDVRQMGLFDGENADHRAIGSGFGVPIPLLALPDTTKFNTYLEAKTEFYEDTVIPESEITSQAFDAIFESEKNGYRFMFDFSHLSCMQKSNTNSATAFKTMVDGMVTAVQNGFVDEKTASATINDYIK